MDPSPALALIRLITFTTAMLLFGSSLFALYAPREGMVRRGPRPRSAARLPRAVALGAGVLLVASLVGWLPAAAAGMNDASDPVPLAALVRTVLLETGFGPVWAVQLGLATLLLGVVLAGATACMRKLVVTLNAMLRMQAVGGSLVRSNSRKCDRLGGIDPDPLAGLSGSIAPQCRRSERDEYRPPGVEGRTGHRRGRGRPRTDGELRCAS